MSDTRPSTAADVLAMDAAHTGSWATCPECDRLVRKYEAQGDNTSDAQGRAMAAHMKASGGG